jgi:hypothetical protein
MQIMKRMLPVVVVAVVVSSGTMLAHAYKSGESPTIAEVYDHSLTRLEKEFVPAAEAMPEDKYDFAPSNGEFKGVRTFAAQVKHVAVNNYEIASGILGEKPPIEIGADESGPAAIKSKAEIIQFLNDSFAYLHKALATINRTNVVESVKSPFGDGTVTRLGLATTALAHPMDHYGQMVEYLRMNGIIPPASR